MIPANIQNESKTKMLMETWKPILDHPDLPKIKDPYKRAMTAIILENQKQFLMNEADIMRSPGFLTETGGYSGVPTNNISGGNISLFDPILISLVRRALPNLIAYDVAGVQPMTGPTGLIFAMRSRYANQTGTEAFYSEANTEYSGFTSANTFGPPVYSDGSATNPVANVANTNQYTTGTAMPTQYAESLGDNTGANNFNEMAFSIERVTVEAKSRALATEYTMELAQDLKAIHGLDAETELSNILSTEILTEINREVIRTLYFLANAGAQYRTAVAGTYNLDTDSNGRWSVERFKGLIMQMEFEANGIAKDTRRGKGNIMIVSSDVASALAMTGVLSYTPNLSADLTVDDTGNTFVGMLHNRIKVFIDPYFGGTTSGQDLCCVGYKGQNPYDAGFFYCPYVPLQMVRAIDPYTFQPKIGFKTRYGMVANPFAQGLTQGLGVLNGRSNLYYRIFQIINLM